MGLSRYHRHMFHNKRFVSIVICENFPQLVIQTLSLYLAIIDGKDRSGLLITIFSMVFTVISICLSLFEFMFRSKYIDNGSILIARFSVESKKVASMRFNEFQQRIIFRKNRFINSLAKCLHLNYVQIDRLIPLQDSNGAILTFIIEADSHYFDHIVNGLKSAIIDGTIAKVKQYL